ncbi:hypothetical protein [Nonomuraea endophytica]
MDGALPKTECGPEPAKLSLCVNGATLVAEVGPAPACWTRCVSSWT